MWIAAFPLPDLPNQNLHFHGIFRSSECTFIFEEHESRKIPKHQGVGDPVPGPTGANSPFFCPCYLLSKVELKSLSPTFWATLSLSCDLVNMNLKEVQLLCGYETLGTLPAHICRPYPRVLLWTDICTRDFHFGLPKPVCWEQSGHHYLTRTETEP